MHYFGACQALRPAWYFELERARPHPFRGRCRPDGGRPGRSIDGVVTDPTGWGAECSISRREEMGDLTQPGVQNDGYAPAGGHQKPAQIIGVPGPQRGAWQTSGRGLRLLEHVVRPGRVDYSR